MENADFIKSLDERIAQLRSLKDDIEFNLDNLAHHVSEMKKQVEAAQDISWKR